MKFIQFVFIKPIKAVYLKLQMFAVRAEIGFDVDPDVWDNEERDLAAMRWMNPIHNPTDSLFINH